MTIDAGKKFNPVSAPQDKNVRLDSIFDEQWLSTNKIPVIAQRHHLTISIDAYPAPGMHVFKESKW